MRLHEDAFDPIAPEDAPKVEPTLKDAPDDRLDLVAKAKDIAAQAAQGKLMLVGRKPNGAFFMVEGVEQITSKLANMLDRQLANLGEGTMEQQYEDLRTNVELVVTGKSNFTKALLITGAPSAGKTYNILQTIKSLGLSEGKDYVRKGGSTTDASAYRTLIERVDGLTIFDDCDSIVDTQNGKNMIKNALDTTSIREITKDGHGLVNTAVLSPHEREEYISALSRALRYEETEDDIIVIKTTYHRMRLLNKILRNYEQDKRRDQRGKNGEDTDENYISSGGSADDVIMEYARNHMPNLFNFQGRVIFISNKDEEEWDSAIRSRCLHQDMRFKSQEMLDMIERICDKMPTPGLSLDDKLEVIHYLRELWESGQIKLDINFRIVQQAWDLRLVPGWKRKIARW